MPVIFPDALRLPDNFHTAPKTSVFFLTFKRSNARQSSPLYSYIFNADVLQMNLLFSSCLFFFLRCQMGGRGERGLSPSLRDPSFIFYSCQADIYISGMSTHQSAKVRKISRVNECVGARRSSATLPQHRFADQTPAGIRRR